MRMQKKVLVIGGAGYVGSALVPALLERGYEVTVYDTYWYGDVFTSLGGWKLHEIRGDIRDKRKLSEAHKGVDAVIHLACISNDPSFDLHPALGRAINRDAFSHILEAARGNHVKRFIYASSSSVYGVKEEREVKEEAKPEPLTDYSRYKWECEQILQKEAEHLPYVIVRPATVCGYSRRLRLDLTVNILTAHAVERGKITVFGGRQLRPNINIKDMVAVYALLLEAPLEKIHGEVFNVGYENHSVDDIAKMVRGVVGNQTALEYVPTDDLRSYHINSDKIQERLGFLPRFTIEEAAGSIVDAYHRGLVINGLENPLYHNIKRMKELLQQGVVLV